MTAADARAWFEANWDPDLALGEWWERLARSGWGFPAWPVEWFGRGPGEADPDSRLAARVCRFSATVDELQTPYLMPQENGNRTEVRWATLTGDRGGLRLEGRPHFELTARRFFFLQSRKETQLYDLAGAGSDDFELAQGVIQCNQILVLLNRLSHDLSQR